MRFISVILLLWFSLLPVKGQSITLSGKISDEKGSGMPGINVMIVKSFESPTIEAYALTDSQGNYLLETSNRKDTLCLLVKGFNIKPIKRRIPYASRTYNFRVKEEAISLKEVTVKSNRIWSDKDTINYRVSSFLSEKDVSIGDVIKKMPGIHVTPTGKIEYNGTPINNFYIEGLDLLKQRYGIATNNISPNDVSTVQVLEHHQPAKALKKISLSNQAAINLKLKDSAKGLFTISALLGAGYNGKYLGEGELFTSYFGRNKQHITTYKGNNNGTGLENEIRDQNDYDANYWLTNLAMPSPPAIEKSKYFDNQSHIVTNSSLIKDKKGNQWNIGLYYLNNDDKKNNFSSTSYMMPDGTLNIIDETISSRERSNQIAGEGYLTINEDKRYVNEHFRGQGEWLNGNGQVLTREEVAQQARYKKINLSNDLHWISKKQEYSGWEVSSHLKFGYKPQNLYVYPNLYKDLFDNASESTGLHQNVDMTRWETRNAVSMLAAIMLGKVRISPSMIANVSYDNMKSRLEALPGLNTQRQMNNDVHYVNIKTGVAANVSYSSNLVNFNLQLPILYNYRLLDQKMQTLRMNKSRCLFEPMAGINLITNQWDFGINFLLLNSSSELEQLYGGYVLNDYRNISAYEARFNDNLMNRYGASVSFKDIYHMFFANIKTSYSRYTTQMLYGQTFEGNLAKIIAKEANTYGDIVQVQLNSSKGFNWKKTNIELNCAWFRKNAPQLRQDEVVRYESNNIFITGKLNIAPFRFLTLDWSENWNKSWSRIKDGDKFTPISTLTSQAGASIKLPLDIALSLSYYNYYNHGLDQGKSLSLADVSLQYKWKTTTFYIDWNNIFDVKTYTYTSLNSLNRYYFRYQIRPASIQLKVRFKIL